MEDSDLTTQTKDSPSAAADSLDRFAEVLEAARATGSRLEKRRILRDYLLSIPDSALALAVTYLTGRPFPRSSNRKLSAGGAALSTALLAARPGLT
ncbi:MAG: hypothetical protein LC772_05220, partial [Chloroflexi bacterium]|nr:hypothetical protein [Chloroflexota bacterium]